MGKVGNLLIYPPKKGDGVETISESEVWADDKNKYKPGEKGTFTGWYHQPKYVIIKMDDGTEKEILKEHLKKI